MERVVDDEIGQRLEKRKEGEEEEKRVEDG